MASEDIGNADPRGLQLALNAWDVQQRLGSPEGELALVQACTYLATAPKSNAVYKAQKSSFKSAKKTGAPLLSTPMVKSQVNPVTRSAVIAEAARN